jgi:LPXTG-motif cell wall-anchored protein
MLKGLLFLSCFSFFFMMTLPLAAAENVISIVGIEVSDEPQLENNAKNTVDGDLETRWSAEGDGQWITFNLGSVQSVEGIGLAFFRGDERNAMFTVEVSTDEKNWTTVIDQIESNGITLDVEQFIFPNAADAKYVKVIGHGNTTNDWNSITEFVAYSAPKQITAANPNTAVNPKTGDQDVWIYVFLFLTSLAALFIFRKKKANAV